MIGRPFDCSDRPKRDSMELMPPSTPSNAEPRAVPGPTVISEAPATLGQRLRSTYVKLVSTSWLLSAILHLLAMLVVGRIFLPLLPPPPIQELVMGETTESVETLEDFQEISVETDMESLDPIDLPAESAIAVAAPKLTMPTEVAVATTAQPALNLADVVVDVTAPSTTAKPSAVSARSGLSASELRHAGGNAGSEAAVKESLLWLVRHQLPDGGWSLQVQQLPGCNCRNPGHKKDEATGEPQAYDARFGATGLALLPFLGSGRTHRQGEYQPVVKAGLAFLVNNMKREGVRASLRDRGNFYSHGICAIALCEAYAMTKDPALAEPAQALINEIVAGQDPQGGGWRYTPRQPGDTSVTGWQFMALKSAHMGGLNVPPHVVEGAMAFLDSTSLYDGAYASRDCVVAKVEPEKVVVNLAAVVDENTKEVKEPARQLTYEGLDTTRVALSVGQPIRQGAPIAPYSGGQSDMNGWRYRYMVVPDIAPTATAIQPNHPTPTLTAVGILCRMYSGWEEDNPLLRRTVDYLSELGPSVAADGPVPGPNMYYNYYATQVLRHQSSVEQWSAWNEKLRNFLIKTQEVSGHERGSWYFGDRTHGDSHGGRLYATAMATMILEVYYRHLPLYQKNVTDSFLE